MAPRAPPGSKKGLEDPCSEQSLYRWRWPLGRPTWVVSEDVLDKVRIAKLERKSRNPLFLLAISGLDPNRSVANLMRFKLPWYRDTRARNRGPAGAC